MKFYFLLVLLLFGIVTHAQDTMYFSEESGWYLSQADSEYECWELIDAEINEAIDEIESNGGEIINTSYGSADIEEEEQDGQTYFKCSCEAELEYILPESSVSFNNGLEITNMNLDLKIMNIVQKVLTGNRTCPPGQGVPKVKEILELHIVEAEPIKARRVASEVPIDIKTKKFTQTNCTERDIEKKYNFTTEVRKGSTFTNTTVHKSGTKLKANVGVKIYGVGGGVEREFTESMSFTNAEKEDFSELVKYQEEEKTKIPANKKQIAISSIEKYSLQEFFKEFEIKYGVNIPL